MPFLIRTVADALIEDGNRIVLVKRGIEPFKERWAIPGGHIEKDETVEQCAVREGEEETGLKCKPVDILGVYSDIKRDPRGQNCCTVFIVHLIGGELKGADDADEAKWFSVDEIAKMKSDDLAFDHWKILQDYLKWRKEKGTYWSSK